MLICENCGWHGDDTQLVALTDKPDDLDFWYCPDCGCTEFEEEEEESNVGN